MSYGKLFLLGCFVALFGMGTATTAGAKSLMDYMICIMPSKYNPWRDSYFERMRAREGGEDHTIIINVITFFDSDGPCASGNKQTDQAKRRELAEYLYSRFGWADVAYYLSLLYGYGNFDDSPIEHFPYSKQGALGIRVAFGDGEELDAEESFRLLKEASDEGIILARLNLAYAYQVGHWGKNGIFKLEKDPQQSLALLEQAISDEKGVKRWYDLGGFRVPWAKFHLAYHYRYGEGADIPTNNEKAFTLFSDVVNDDYYPYPNAAIELALMHMERCADATTHQKVSALLEQAQGQMEKMEANNKEQFLADYQQKMNTLSDYLQDSRKEITCH